MARRIYGARARRGAVYLGVLMGRGALIAALMLGAFAGPVHAATVDVTVRNFAFTPAALTITQGDSVTWTFAGPDTNHSTTTVAQGSGQSETWDSDPGNPFPNHQVGDKFSWNFPNPGEFAYFCKTHSTMTGKIVVRPKINDPNPPPQDVVAPKFGTPRVSVKRRQAKFTLDEDAAVSAKLVGPTRRNLSLAGRAGPNVLKLPKALKPGRYALTLRATDTAGNRSSAAKVKFRVPARPR